MYEFETWSPASREEQGLGAFEDRLLRRIFGPPREEVPRGLSKVCNADLHDLYNLLTLFKMIKSRIIGWMGHVSCMRVVQDNANKP